MKSTIQFLTCVATALASPFTESNSTFFRHDTGQISTRISQKPGNVAPAKISNVSKNWKLTHSQWLSQVIYGKPEATKRFEENLKELHSTKQPVSSKRRHLLKQANIQVKLDGEKSGFTYTGPIHMGQNFQEMRVVYDTGSDWLSIEGSNCTMCAGDKFDAQVSGTRKNDQSVSRMFGSVTLTGHVWTDRVCIAETTCIGDFEFYLIDSQTGINGFQGIQEPMDGILGLARDKPNPKLNMAVGPLIVKKLTENNYAQFDVFAFYLTDPSSMNDNISWVDFNGFKQEHIKNGDEKGIVWLSLEDNFFWQSNCQGVSFGYPTVENSFNFGAGTTVLSVFDTGTSFTMIPKYYFEMYMQQLTNATQIENSVLEDGYLAFPCSEQYKLKPLYFMFAGHWYEMSVADFVFDASARQDKSLCALSIVANQQDFFLFGNSFLRGYYSIHDMKDGFLGIAPHKTSSKGFVFAGDVPSQLLTGVSVQSFWSILIMTAFFAGWALLIKFVAHDILVTQLGWSEEGVVAVYLVITGIVATIWILYVNPELNKLFADVPDITDVDPSQIDNITSMVQSSYGMSTAVLFSGAFAANKYFKGKNDNQKKEEEQELLKSPEQTITTINLE